MKFAPWSVRVKILDAVLRSLTKEERKYRKVCLL
jgi:hypothetical protein